MSVNPYTGLVDNPKGTAKKPMTLEDLVGGLTTNHRKASDKLLMDYLTGTATPKHLNEFRLLYQRLRARGVFEEAKRDFETNKEYPPMIKDYGKSLVSLVTKERKLDKKYEYFVAFMKLIDYLAGRLGE